MKIAVGDQSAEVRIEGGEAVLGERRVPFRVHRREGDIEAIEVEGRVWKVRAVAQGDSALVWCGGRVFEVERAASSSAREIRGSLASPMPGRVRQVLVAVGDQVSRGQALLVLEAMKMEHAIRSPRDGVVAALACKEGDLVEAGVALAEIA